MKKISIGSIRNTFFYLKDFCEDTAENIRETTVTVVDSAKLQYRITSKRNTLNAMYASLGKSLYSGANGLGEPGEKSDEIGKLCDRIEAKEEILKGLEQQLRIVSGKVLCSSWGRFMSERYSYCPYCGKRVSENLEEDEFFASDITADELDEVRQLDDI